MPKLKLTIDGMSCGHCVRSVQTAIDAIPGVKTEDVQVGSAIVDFAEPDVLKEIRAAIEEEGYVLVEEAPA